MHLDALGSVKSQYCWANQGLVSNIVNPVDSKYIASAIREKHGKSSSLFDTIDKKLPRPPRTLH